MAPFRITGININNLGVFDDLNLRFSAEKSDGKAEIHIFTGDNGTGKTTLLRALTYFDHAYNTNYWAKDVSDIKRSDQKDLLQAKASSRKLKSPANASPITLHYNSEQVSFPLNGRPRKEDFFDLYYSNVYNGRQSEVCFFSYSGNRSIAASDSQIAMQEKYNPLLNALDFDRPDTNPNLFQWIIDTYIDAAVAMLNHNDNEAKEHLNVLEKIEDALFKIMDRKVKLNVAKEDGERKVKIKMDNELIDFGQLADGHKSLVHWLIDLIFRLESVGFWKHDGENKKTFVLFLDEIEVHLHPSAQRRILPLIQELFPTAQIFLTTHSPFILGSIKGAWIYKFGLKEGISNLIEKPIKSEDGKSYRYILEEVLGINKEFGENVEIRLKDFYIKRDSILKVPDDEKKKEFLDLACSLADEGDELRVIVGVELRQLSRITHSEFNLKNEEV